MKKVLKVNTSQHLVCILDIIVMGKMCLWDFLNFFILQGTFYSHACLSENNSVEISCTY